MSDCKHKPDAKTQAKKKNCRFCSKTGLRFLPLVYAVVTSPDKAAHAALPKIGGKLGDQVTDLALSAEAQYAVRLTPPGYLYLLLKRKGVKYWKSYLVQENAYLYELPGCEPPQIEPPAFSCNPEFCGIDASLIDIPQANQVPNAWLLYTPSAMTQAKLDEYKANAESYGASGKMQHFSPAGWLSGNIEQKHTVLAAELFTTVAEFALFTHVDNPAETPLGKALQEQLIPAIQDAYQGKPPSPQGCYSGRLGALYNTMRHDGYGGIVAFNHIGITQALNNYRNDALTPIERLLASTTDGIDNQRRLEVSQAIEDVRSAFVDHGIAVAKEWIDMMDKANYPDTHAGVARQLRAMGRIKEAEEVEAEAKRHAEAKALNREKMLRGDAAAKEWERKYLKLLAYNEEVLPFQNRLKTTSDHAETNAKQRTSDHVQWVTADRLVDAFDIFDPNDAGSGFCFTQEHMHCTFGMFGVKSNVSLLQEWLNISKIERKNLYMRANCYNLKTLQDQASQAFADARQHVAEAGGVAAVSNIKWAKVSKNVVDGFKKVDSAWDEWLRDKVVLQIHKGEIPFDPKNPIHNLSKFHRNCEGLMYARFSEWTQALTTKGGKLDQGINAVVGMLIYGKLGELAQKIGFEEFLAKIKPEKIAQIKEKHRTQERMQKANRQAKAEAAAKAEADASKVEGSIDELIKDEQKKVREKVKITLDEMDKGKRPATNNFRQARIGCLLAAIEGYSLTTKLADFHDDPRAIAELAGSALSFSSISIDIVYSVTKSIREIDPYKAMPGVNKGADLMRGGMKLSSGFLSMAAGAISVVLDIGSIVNESEKGKRNSVLLAVYTSRAVTGGFGAGLGAVAAFSYGAPIFTRLAESGLARQSSWLLKVAVWSTETAKGLEAARTLWLIRVARVNLIGLALTAGEIIYRCCFMDDELEKWCKACTFRKDKGTGWFSATPYPDSKAELEALAKAFHVANE